MRSETDQLIAALNDRTLPLDVRLDEMNWIVAANYQYESGFDVGITLDHPEGPISIGFDRPKRRDVIDLPWDSWDEMDYAKKKELIADLLPITYGFTSLEEDPWIRRNDRGEIDPSSDIQAQLADWLDSPVSDDELEGLLVNEVWPESSTGEFTPGFAILETLTRAESVSPKEIEELGLYIHFSGSPGGGQEGVRFDGDVIALQTVLDSQGLPYRFLT